jgi:hypothetical protein
MRVKNINPEFCPDNEFLPRMLSLFDHILETFHVEEIVNNEIHMEKGIRGAMNVYSRPFIIFIRELTTFEKVNPYAIKSFSNMIEAFLKITDPLESYKDAWDLVNAMDENLSEAITSISCPYPVAIGNNILISAPSDASLVATWRLENGL